MDIDFSFWLVIATAISGMVVLLDRILLRPRRVAAVSAYQQEAGERADQAMISTLAREPGWVEFPKSFFPVLAIVLVVRSFMIEPFKIPTGSMEPTLLAGDFILVNKYVYGLRLPVLGTKILSLGDPEQGDVLVFKYPEDPSINYIKRVIAGPGDTVSYYNKELKVNGEVMSQKLLAQEPPARPEFNLSEEQLGSVSHRIKTTLGANLRPGKWEVPAGHYFVMGDNRDNSRDSRVWGFVPDANVVGKAFAIWMHMPNWMPSFRRNGLIE
ncbi:MAG: signal peptidase I [Gammaproteobacteria bacterium]